ncbi:MAG: heavy metal-binding domain-containing protein [Solirubrobacterales bacterium]|nr:heavy metal-binding domain-containing protein [Solirubrobacterales bacterium]
MGFFGGGRKERPEAAEALARIEGGGIPVTAERRLRSLRKGGLFTSGLSVSEVALLDRLGTQPLAQVMGASFVRTGWQYLPSLAPGTAVISDRPHGSSFGPARMYPYAEPSLGQVSNYQWHTEVVCELEVLSDAWRLARRRALDRLTEEALQVGADAVVGVHLRRGEHDAGQGTIEYVVSGTAIRWPQSDGTAWPVLSDASVQDYWRLRSAGHEPAGLLATTAVVFASPPRTTRARRLRALAQNQELSEVTRAFAAARETVRARLLGQVSDTHGTGAVGVEFRHSVSRDTLAVASSVQSPTQRGWHRGGLGLPYRVSGRGHGERSGWVITMHAAGTAIRSRPGQSPGPVKTTVRMGAR